jgi:ParB family chromosome partitioning protein
MNTKKRKLNRGLDALLGTDLTKKAAAGTADASTTSQSDGDLRQLPLEFLQRGKYQPRIDFDEAALQELADSIKAQGVMQPIVVRSSWCRSLRNCGWRAPLESQSASCLGYDPGYRSRHQR